MAVEQRSSFAQHLRRLREDRGLTQEQLAERAGLTAKGIGALESGRRQHPYPHTVRVLATALQLSDEERAALVGAVPGRGNRTAPHAVVSTPALVVSASPLIGREQDTTAVQDLLSQSSTRLITLTGPGGVGKTSLALAVAQTMVHHYPDGVSLVALAPLAAPTLLLPTIAQALGLRDTGGGSIHDLLYNHLREKCTLLILDNLEHILEAAPEVPALLEGCPLVKVLVTSRASLRVRGEREFPVGPLAVPDTHQVVELSRIARVSSVALFVERVREVNPAFVLTLQNAASVATICRRLDGLPLALELVAAQGRALEPAELLAQLDRTLAVAKGSAVPLRQQTMRATLDWSYALLSPAERTLFRCLALFAGGWTLPAAEVVGAVVGDVDDVLDVLGGLVEQSLVTMEVSEDQARYGMLEPVRQYAEERLRVAGEAARTRKQHASFFLTFAETAEPELWGSNQVEWLDRLEAEHGNLRAAMAWALDSEEGDTAVAARLSWAMWLFWWYRGYQREGLRLVEEVLRSNLTPVLRIKPLMVAGSLALSHGDYARCDRYFGECFALAEQSGDEFMMAHARTGKGATAMSQSQYDVATYHFEAALDVFRVSGVDFIIAQLTSFLGMIALTDAKYDRAAQLFEEGLAVARRRGDKIGAYLALYNRAITALSVDDFDYAATLLNEGLTLSEEVGDQANLAYCLEGLAVVAQAHGQAERSARLFGLAEALHGAVGVPVYVYYELQRALYERAQSAVRTQLGEDTFAQAWAEGRRITLEDAVAYALSVAEPKRAA